MFRAILELIVTIIVAMAARAILASLMKGFANASRSAYNPGQDFTANQQHGPEPGGRPPGGPRVSVAGELHKDPVCGTYVAESTKFKRGSGRDAFYYCSESCKDKHALAARS